MLTRHSADGEPLEQLLNGTYTPASALLFAGPFDQVYDWFVIAHFWILALGIYLLAIDLKARPLEAALAATVGALAGPVFSFEALVVGLQGLAYLPWALLCWRKVITAPVKIAWAGGLALCLGFQAQALIPPFLLLTAVAFLVATVQAGLPRDKTTWLLALLSVGLGLGLASIELMPVLETLGGTARAGLTYDEAQHWSLTWPQLIDFFAATFWTPPELVFARLSFATGFGHGYLASLYLGTCLTLIFAGSYPRGVWVVAGLAVLFVVVALGASTPVHRAVWSLPLLSSSRYPIKYVTVASAALPVLSIWALRTFSARRVAIAAALQAAALLSLYFVVELPEFRDYLGANNQVDAALIFQGLSVEEMGRLIAELMGSRVMVAAGFVLVLLVLAIAHSKEALSATWVSVAVVAVVSMDLAWAASHVAVGFECTAPPPAAIAARLSDPQSRHIALSPRRRGATIIRAAGERWDQAVQRSAAQRGRAQAYPSRLFAAANVNSITNVNLIRAFDAASTAPGAEGRRIFARFGVAHVMTHLPIDDLELVARVDLPSVPEPELVYALDPVRPYATAYTRWLNPIDQPPSKQGVQAFWANPATWHTAFVFPTDAIAETATSTTCRTPTTTYALSAANRVIDVDVTTLDCEALVVVLEPRMPGWQVSIDGEPARLFEAEGPYLATRIQPGRSRVRFEFVSRAEWWAPLSASSLAVCLLLIGIGLSRRSRPGGTEPLR